MLHGVLGHPYIDLERYLDDVSNLETTLAVIHEEVCLALTQVPHSNTGGSHRSMGIMPEPFRSMPEVDYGEILAKLDVIHARIFLSLADQPGDLPDDVRADHFGEERQYPLSSRQMTWLETRFGAYFPWKYYVELIPGTRWEEKSQQPRRFTQQAEIYFPSLLRFIRTLPFISIGSCKLLGLAGHDHGTVHRDADPKLKPEVDHFITICPAGNKRLFIWDDTAKVKMPIGARLYWFNDSDYHGVEADPYFRYSIRVDGRFDPAFLTRLSG